MTESKLKYANVTEKIIGCAMEVHNFLGNGFQEVIYQRALAIEFEAAGIQFMREKDLPIIYKGKDIGTRRVDFLVENTIMVELKAISELDDSHYAQIINYLEAYRLEIGLLINFGGKRLTWKRFIKTPKVLTADKHG